jgi:hypothetical protein
MVMELRSETCEDDEKPIATAAPLLSGVAGPMRMLGPFPSAPAVKIEVPEFKCKFEIPVLGMEPNV